VKNLVLRDCTPKSRTNKRAITPDEEEKARRRTQKHREARIAKGLCPRCGQRPVASGRKQCQECIDKYRAYQTAYRKGKLIKGDRK
jgi:uncharacterized OB-fold protein